MKGPEACEAPMFEPKEGSNPTPARIIGKATDEFADKEERSKPGAKMSDTPEFGVKKAGRFSATGAGDCNGEAERGVENSASDKFPCCEDEELGRA